MQDDQNRQPSGGTPSPNAVAAGPGGAGQRPIAPPPVPTSEIYAGRAEPDPVPARPSTGRIDHLAGDDTVSSPAQAGERQQPISGLLVSVIAGVLVLGLGVLALGLNESAASIPLLRATDLTFWLAATVVILLVAAGAQFAELSERAAAASVGQARERSGKYTAWLVPAASTIAATLLIATYHNVWTLVLGPVLVIVSTFVALFSRDLLDDLTDSALRIASLMHGALVHVVAFVALSMIYLNKLPEWLSAGLVALISGMLILETLQRAEITTGHRLGYAGLGAIVMGQCAIAINWWLTWNWTGGMALLVCFFLVAGILLTYGQQSDLRPRDVAFYGGLGSVALATIAMLAL